MLPPARAFGAYYDATGDLQLIRDIAERVAWELQAVGFNLNYAPVLDVDSCPDNPIIGDRAFHSDPERVAALAGAIISGFGRAGLACCGKHFPGHGDTSEDSHLTLPQVAQTEAVLRERGLVPFRAAIAAGIPALMTAHVLYPALDAACCGTLSPRINRDLLRSELGFAGVLCSDDLFMKGIAADATAVPKAAGQAFAAGCDLLLLCHDEAVQRETIARLEAELGGSEALQGVLATSAPRVQQFLSLIAAADGVAARRQSDPADLANKLTQLGS